jgi:RNA polymerase sigma-70 factor (ECF subfamily)
MMTRGTGFFTEIDDLAVAKARSGDLGALEGLYEAFSEAVFTLATRLCRSREEAEEVLQETFLEVVRSIRSFRGDGAFGAWIRRIAVSKALTFLRRKSRVEIGLGVAEGTVRGRLEVMPSPDLEGGWKRVDLERALVRLPDAARAVVWLHDVEGLTHREIAEIFGRSPSFSKSQLSRAHARLRTWLGPVGGAENASGIPRTAGASRR